jgi:hypothetical protein
MRAVVVLALVATGVLIQPSGSAAQVPASSKPAIFHDGTWYLRDTLSTGTATSTFRYGRPGDIPVMGDWDGNGTDTVGIVRFTEAPAGGFTYTWHLRNTNSAGAASVTPFTYGEVRFVAVDQLGTIPVVGDWNGDGLDTVGVMVYSFDLDGHIRWDLRNTNAAGAPDISTHYSRGRDVPVTGDWDGDGDDSIGVVRGDTWLLRNSPAGGPADVTFVYGSPSYLELHVPGDWDGDGTYTPAVLRNKPPTDESGGFESWLFRNSNSSGAATGQITYGSDAQALELPIEFIPRLSWR